MMQTGFTHRLNGEPIPPRRAPVEKPGPLCILACRWCNDPKFLTWMRSTTHAGVLWPAENFKDAAEFVKELCEIGSRKELDTDILAGQVFKKSIREPYMKWLEKNS